MDFSVLIPARNSARTLPACLQSIFDSSLKPSEVIVVDDGSEDGTGDLARSLGVRVIRIEEGKGPMQPRFAGARASGSGLLVFVDSDVCVRPDTFSRLLSRLLDSGASAVTGMLARESRVNGFWSAYKNEYMNFIFSTRPEEVNFLYGSVFAVRRDDMIPFEPVNEPFGCLVSDTELGLRLSARGRRVLLHKGVEVEHLKEYGFLSLMRNDFVIPFMFARILPAYGRKKEILGRRSFSHAGLWQVLANAFSFLGWLSAAVSLCFPAALWISALLWIVFLTLWFPFFRRVSRRGLSFSAAALGLSMIDGPVMFAGMCAGFAYDHAVRWHHRIRAFSDFNGAREGTTEGDLHAGTTFSKKV